MGGRSAVGSPWRNVSIAARLAASAGSIFIAASAPYAKASAAASAALPAGTSYTYFFPGFLVKRQPLATIHGLRVGEATPARAVTPGVGSGSRVESSASVSAQICLMPAASSAARFAACVQTHGSE